jgi:hypothetical protein
LPAPNLDEINTLTTKKIMPGLVDNFFKNSPVLAFLKRNRYKVWTGGPQIQENFLYKPMKGGSYRKGATFDISKRQTKTGLLFDPKFYEVNVTEYTEDVEVIVRGAEAVLSLVQADLSNAALTMSAILAIAIYHHGQNIAGDDRSAEINGLEEALTDGINATYTGNTFVSYGGQARADVSPALNTPTGIISSPNIAGTMSYRVLEHSYQSCVIGDEHPVMGVTTNTNMGFINENFQPQQRIDTTEPTIGYPGVKFKQATLVEDQYCPGAFGVNDPDIGNYLIAPVAGQTANESFWWINPGKEGDDAFLNLYFSASPKYQFGWTGFKVAQDSTVVAGQILFGGNFTARAPRLMRALFGFRG